MKNILLKGLFVSASIIFVTSSASALTVSPARAEFTAMPGESVKSTFLLINEQDTDQTYYTSVENFDAQALSVTGGFSTSKSGLSSWVHLAEKITVKKGERISIPYSFTIPKDASLGGSSAAIFLTTTPPQDRADQAATGAKVGILVTLKVSNPTSSSCLLLTKGLSKGSENSEVLKLQQFLFDSGYLTAKPNGYFGAGTVTAVKKFQRANGVAQTGWVGTTTRGKVKSASCQVSSTSVSLPVVADSPLAPDPTSSDKEISSLFIKNDVEALHYLDLGKIRYCEDRSKLKSEQCTTYRSSYVNKTSDFGVEVAINVHKKLDVNKAKESISESNSKLNPDLIEGSKVYLVRSYYGDSYYWLAEQKEVFITISGYCSPEVIEEVKIKKAFGTKEFSS